MVAEVGTHPNKATLAETTMATRRRPATDLVMDQPAVPQTANEPSPFGRGDEQAGARRRIDRNNPFPMLTTDMPGQIVELHSHVTNMYETLMGLIERIESKCDRVKGYNRDVVNGVRTQLLAKVTAAEGKLATVDNRVDGFEV